jgi:hypothetical protein
VARFGRHEEASTAKTMGAGEWKRKKQACLRLQAGLNEGPCSCRMQAAAAAKGAAAAAAATQSTAANRSSEAEQPAEAAADGSSSSGGALRRARHDRDGAIIVRRQTGVRRSEPLSVHGRGGCCLQRGAEQRAEGGLHLASATRSGQAAEERERGRCRQERARKARGCDASRRARLPLPRPLVRGHVAASGRSPMQGGGRSDDSGRRTWCGLRSSATRSRSRLEVLCPASANQHGYHLALPPQRRSRHLLPSSVKSHFAELPQAVALGLAAAPDA